MAVRLSYQDRFQGVTIVGETGTGKTNFQASLFLHDIANGCGGCLVEPHGDLTKTVIAGIPEQRLDDVILLDFTDGDFPFAINPFMPPQPLTMQNMSAAANLVSSLFHELWSAGFATPRLMEVLNAVSYTLLENPGSTLCEVGLLVSHDTVRTKMVANVTNPEIVAFWEGYNRLSQRDRGQLIESTLNKFRAYATDPMLRNILGQSKTSLSFRRLMDDGKILLILLSPRHEQASRLIGALILTQLQMAAFSRSDTTEEHRRPFMLFIDEFQRWDFEAMAVFIHEMRKWKIASCFAFQTLQALSEANRAAVLACGNLMCFRVSGLDSPILAKSFDASPQQVEREIIGSEPVRMPCSDVLGHMERSGHSNAVIAQWVSDWLMPLASMIRAISGSMHPIHLGRVKAMFSHGHAVQGRMLLNEALSECQRTGRADVAIDPLALYMLGAASSAKITEVFADKIKRTEWNGGFFHGFRDRAYGLGHPSLLTDQEKLGRFLSIHGPGFWDSLLGRKTITPGQAFIRMLKSLRAVMAILCTEPILVDTGQYVPKYQIRTFSDVEHQISNELSQLQNFYARVRFVSSGEHVLQTKPLPPLLTGDALTARIQRIKRNMWEQGYTRSYKEVEKEIRERQDQLKTPVAEGKRRGRRAEDPPPTSA